MYGISTCLVLVLIVMGVSMMNNFSKMKSLQNKINVVAEGEKQTSSPDVKETSGAAATVEKNQEAADTEKESKEITEENEGEEQTEDKNTLWPEGTIVSANHGRLVILPFIKENGEHVKGHTRNAPKDGPAKPRHPSQYVEIPFTKLNDDLMIGLFGELPYE